MNEDPLQEEALAQAVRGLPKAPRPVHAPPTTARVANKSYADAGRPPDGFDEQGPFRLVESRERRNGLVRCPDCGLVLIAAHDDEMSRVGFGFLVCWDLAYPYRLPLSVRPCHEGCVVACGRVAGTVS